MKKKSSSDIEAEILSEGVKLDIAAQSGFLKELLANAIPVKEAVFHRVVKSKTGEPETAFYAKDAKPSRLAKMGYSPHGLICEQKGYYIIVPLANVVYAKLE